MQDKPTLRVITAGSVDDGKSTLIGRLLYDAKVLTQDQMASIDSGGKPDFAALTDGLIAEKEQGITIDVAYRYFATTARRYILADCPGHEDYTRNMVTGASTADVAIILIDPTKIDFAKSDLLLTQTKRHSAVLMMLGVKKIIAAINKMDAINYDQKKYDAIKNAYLAYHQKLWQTMNGDALHQPPTIIPISALLGDNIMSPAKSLVWFDGPSLLPYLDNLLVDDKKNLSQQSTAVFGVQYVLKNSNDGKVFRGYQGRLDSGTLSPNDSIIIMPQNDQATIKKIYDSNGSDMALLTAGQMASIELTTEREAGRGSYLVKHSPKHDQLEPQKQFTARLCWFDKEPWQKGRKYIIKHLSFETPAIITPKNLLHLDDMLAHHKADDDFLVAMNSIIIADIKTQQPMMIKKYYDNHNLGSFIIIDPVTYHTVACATYN